MISIEYDEGSVATARRALGILLEDVENATVSMSWDADNDYFEEGLRVMPDGMRRRFRRGILNTTGLDSAAREWVREFGCFSNDLTIRTDKRMVIDVADGGLIIVSAPEGLLSRVGSALGDHGVDFARS